MTEILRKVNCRAPWAKREDLDQRLLPERWGGHSCPQQNISGMIEHNRLYSEAQAVWLGINTHDLYNGEKVEVRDPPLRYPEVQLKIKLAEVMKEHGVSYAQFVELGALECNLFTYVRRGTLNSAYAVFSHAAGLILPFEDFHTSPIPGEFYRVSKQHASIQGGLLPYEDYRFPGDWQVLGPVDLSRALFFVRAEVYHKILSEVDPTKCEIAKRRIIPCELGYEEDEFHYLNDVFLYLTATVEGQRYLKRLLGWPEGF